ncbi:MAG: hypothetical protein RJB38_1284 [Pseudomonadota bacterium]|jgi:long-chain acyl-CoA synthetase
MPLILENSLTRTLLSRCEHTPDAGAFSERTPTEWQDHRFQNFLDDVYALSLWLQTQGVQPAERIALVAQTSYDLLRMQWAIIASKAIPVPLSPLQTNEDLLQIFRDCEPAVLILESEALQERLISADPQSLKAPRTKLFSHFPEWLESGRALLTTEARATVREALWNADSNALFLLMYTSGTTGEPKGSMISQAQFMRALRDSAEVFRDHLLPEQETTLTILPLANIFGQFEVAVGFVFGWKTAFATRPDRLQAELAEVQPSLLFGVPKIFEKLLEGIQENIDSKSPTERAIIERLLDAVRRVAESKVTHERPRLADTAESILAHQTIIKAIQKQLGGRLKFAISGGAPLPPDLAAELKLFNLILLEGYGLTETCGPVAIRRPDDLRSDSVGPPLSGVDVQILSDGEIIVRSPEPFLGYWRKPEVTAETLREGWIHTGDIGYLDQQGRLHITDRKKDLIVLSTGRTIAPQKIEARVRSSKYVLDLMALGDRRSFVGALVTLRKEEIIKFCQERQILFSQFPELVNHPKIRSLIQAEIEQLNDGLAPYERIRRFVILPESLSTRKGEVTHTQKLRRRQIEEHHPEAVRALFEPPFTHKQGPLDQNESLG